MEKGLPSLASRITSPFKWAANRQNRNNNAKIAKQRTMNPNADIAAIANALPWPATRASAATNAPSVVKTNRNPSEILGSIRLFKTGRSEGVLDDMAGKADQKRRLDSG